MYVMAGKCLLALDGRRQYLYSHGCGIAIWRDSLALFLSPTSRPWTVNLLHYPGAFCFLYPFGEPMITNPDSLVTPAQAAHHLQVSERTLRRAVDRRELPAYKLGDGHLIRYSMNELNDWARARAI